jgi:tRNA(Ile)-lysidine synthase
LTLLDARVAAEAGRSVEEAAREARYACWRDELKPGELLLTAQHADDQLETTLLALLRGAGPAGLAAMPSDAPLGKGRLLRPLLALPRATLLEYATALQLPVIEDPTNADPRFDRNFLRLQVLPHLRQRWPGASATVSRSARHCARAAALQAAAGAADLEAAADGEGLELAVLRRWPEHRAMSALRIWFTRSGLRSPGTRHLQQIIAMLRSRGDAHPRLDLPQVSVRVHAGRLLLRRRDAGTAMPRAPISWSWRRGSLPLPDGSELAVLPDHHGDLDLAALPARLRVRFLEARPPGRSLRRLLQELEVPQWDRGRLPLLFGSAAAGAPLAIADLWLSRGLQQHAGSRRRGRIVWRVPR